MAYLLLPLLQIFRIEEKSRKLRGTDTAIDFLILPTTFAPLTSEAERAMSATMESVTVTCPDDGNRIRMPSPGDGITAKKKEISIEIVPSSAADDARLVSTVVDFINEAYHNGEGDLFQDGYQRTSIENVTGYIRKNHLAIAYAAADPATSQREAVGCLVVEQASPGVGHLCMLAFAKSHRGGGLGRDLVSFGQSHCRNLGCRTMRIEILIPLGVEHAGKARLLGWYHRLGYRLVRLGDFQSDYPHVAVFLKGPTEYRILEKELPPSPA